MKNLFVLLSLGFLAIQTQAFVYDEDGGLAYEPQFLGEALPPPIEEQIPRKDQDAILLEPVPEEQVDGMVSQALVANDSMEPPVLSAKQRKNIRKKIKKKLKKAKKKLESKLRG